MAALHIELALHLLLDFVEGFVTFVELIFEGVDFDVCPDFGVVVGLLHAVNPEFVPEFELDGLLLELLLDVV